MKVQNALVSYPDFTQELPRKWRPNESQKPKGDAARRANFTGRCLWRCCDSLDLKRAHFQRSRFKSDPRNHARRGVADGEAADFTQELVQRHASSWCGSAADWPAMVSPLEAVRMATLQQQISDKFLAKLAESKDVDARSEPTDQRLGRLTESWRSTGIERDPQKLF